MTLEAQRVAIAEMVGWTRISKGTPISSGNQLLGSKSYCMGTPPQDKDKPEDEQAYERVPDYLNDLNAMFEAEKSLDVNVSSGDSPRYVYARYLYDIVANQEHGERQPFRATAAQRAEAFLRTVGKWVEGESSEK